MNSNAVIRTAAWSLAALLGLSSSLSAYDLPAFTPGYYCSVNPSNEETVSECEDRERQALAWIAQEWEKFPERKRRKCVFHGVSYRGSYAMTAECLQIMSQSRLKAFLLKLVPQRFRQIFAPNAKTAHETPGY